MPFEISNFKGLINHFNGSFTIERKNDKSSEVDLYINELKKIFFNGAKAIYNGNECFITNIAIDVDGHEFCFSLKLINKPIDYQWTETTEETIHSFLS